MIYRYDPYSEQSELYVSNGEGGARGVVASINPDLDTVGIEAFVDVETGERIGFYITGFHRWTKRKIEQLRQFPDLETVRFTREEVYE